MTAALERDSVIAHYRILSTLGLPVPQQRLVQSEVEAARAALEKFGGDSIGETKRNFDGYLQQLKRY